MKLDNITINDQVYYFDYIQPNELPEKNSLSVDYWGYYNGKNNGPFLASYNYENYQVSRAVDVTKANIGLINKVIYPLEKILETI